MRNIIKQKQGISEIVGYILLITISLSLSFLVYTWMKRQAPTPVIECPDTLSMILQTYSCNNISHSLNLTLKNNGLYDIQGAIIKVSKNNSNIPPIYPLNFTKSSPEGEVVAIGNIEYQFTNNLSSTPVTLFFDYKNYSTTGIKKISLIPLYATKKEKIICSQQEIQQILNGCD